MEEKVDEPKNRAASFVNLKTYTAILATLGIGLAASWIYWYGLEWSSPLVIGAAVCCVLLLIIERFPISVSDRWSIDASDIVIIVSVVLIGPFWVAVALLPATFLIAGQNLNRLAYENARNTVEIFLTGTAFSLFATPLIVEPSPASIISTTYATLIAGVTLLLINHTTNAGLLYVKYDEGIRSTWKSLIEPYLISDAVNVVTAGLGILALLIYGPVAAIVVVVGAVVSQILVYRTKENVRENAELRERIASLEESLSVSNLTFGAMMIEDLGRQDGYTHLHSAATSVYCTDIASELNLEPETTTRLGMAGLLHNIGMFGMPRELLRATGSLNSIAKARIREHPVRGEEALASVPEFREMSKWVRWHHERPDGRGYPDRLRANWIPLQSRILAVAQAYAAMVLDQPRRPGLEPSVAREQLNLGAGSQFDEVVVRAFLRILDTESEGYRSADDHRFGFGLRGGTRNLENTAD